MRHRRVPGRVGRRFSRTDAPPPYGLTKIKSACNWGTEASSELAMILKSGRTRRSTAARMAASRWRECGPDPRASRDTLRPATRAGARARHGDHGPRFRGRRNATCRPAGPLAGVSGWRVRPAPYTGVKARLGLNTIHFGGADHRTLWSAAFGERWQASVFYTEKAGGWSEHAGFFDWCDRIHR
jgi:hypothetical protein